MRIVPDWELLAVQDYLASGTNIIGTVDTQLKITSWWLVSTPLKDISQNGNLPQVGGEKIFLFEQVIFRFNVSFPGCTQQNAIQLPIKSLWARSTATYNVLYSVQAESSPPKTTKKHHFFVEFGRIDLQNKEQ